MYSTFFHFFTTSALAHYDNPLTSHAVSHISSLLSKLDTNTYIVLFKSQVLQVGFMSQIISRSLLHYVLGINTFSCLQLVFLVFSTLPVVGMHLLLQYVFIQCFLTCRVWSYSLCLLSSATSTYEHCLKPSSEDLTSVSIYLVLM